MNSNQINSGGQGGMATLTISLILLLSLTVVAVAVSQSGVLQQRISGNDYRAKGVRDAAEAGLDYMVQYMEQNPPNWTAYSTSTMPAAAVSIAVPSYVITSGISSGATSYADYTFSNNGASGLAYQVASVQPKLAKITSQAWLGSDPSVTAKVSEYVTDTTDLTTLTRITAPPLSLNGCLGSGISGNPVLTTHMDPSTGIMTSKNAADNYVANNPGTQDSDCIVPSPHGSSGFNLTCTTVDGKNCTTNNSDCTLSNPNCSYSTNYKNNDLWSYYFPDISRQQMESLSSTQADAVTAGTMNTNYSDCANTNPSVPKRTIYYLTKADFPSNSKWQTDVGCAQYPVILVFAADPTDPTYDPCDKINGGPTIYGIVFIDGNCPNNDAKGWGGVHIYGSLAVNGNLNSFSSTAVISELDTGTSTSTTTGLTGTYAPVPGTWKDWTGS